MFPSYVRGFLTQSATRPSPILRHRASAFELPPRFSSRTPTLSVAIEIGDRLLALLATPLENLQNRAERLAPQIAAANGIAAAEAIAARTFLGGGSVPTQEIPTWCVAVTPADQSVDELSSALRRSAPSVFGRI